MLHESQALGPLRQWHGGHHASEKFVVGLTHVHEVALQYEVVRGELGRESRQDPVARGL